MEAEVVRTFRFEAAHALPDVPEGHKCRRMHGHGYRIDIHVTGKADPETGWVIDFGEIKLTVEGILDELDHRCLNDVAGLENPTAELLALYIWQRAKAALPGLSAVTVWESETSRCIYCGG